jgi:hypothetical protein
MNDSSFGAGHAIYIDLDDLFLNYGGVGFNDGIYRVHNQSVAAHWSQRVHECFPRFKSEVIVFGQSWQGDQFAWSPAAKGRVFLFQIATGEVFDVSESLGSFHEQELVDHAREALNRDLWEAWIACGGQHPSASECIGYRTPLFLGGESAIQNLELCDAEVYWEVTTQLRRQVEKLPQGTPISKVGLD